MGLLTSILRETAMALSRSKEAADTTASTTIPGFAFYVRNEHGREFLLFSSMGKSRTRAKQNLLAVQHRRMEARLPKFEVLGRCDVSIAITGARWESGQPPVSNLFVAEGCEQFGEAA